MNQKFKWIAIVGVGAGLLCGAIGTARAGLRSTGFTVNISALGRLAYGQLGDIRSSGDIVEFLQCQVDSVAPGEPSIVKNAIPGVTSVTCSGHDGGSQQFTCTSTSPALITAALSIHSDSYLFVSYDGSGNCTEIMVQNGSQYSPKY